MLTIILLACNSQETKRRSPQATTPKFKLSINTTEATSNTNLKLNATLDNHSDDTIQLTPLYLWHDPILKLVVMDSAGNPVPTVPPAMPPHPDSPVYSAMVLPNEAYEINYSLHLFSPPLSKGKYRVTM